MTNNTLIPSVSTKMRQHCIKALSYAVISFLLFSCGKDQLNFPKSAGKTVSVVRPSDNNFTKIYLNDDVNLVISQGAAYDIKLEGGENLLPGIETSINDSILTIRNNNTYNWLRSYDKVITAYVTMPHILELHYEATSTVTNTDTIREDSLTVSATGGSGYIDLIIHTGTSKLSIIDGSVDMNIRGKTAVNFIYSGAYGPFHCLDLQSDFLFMRNASTNDCYVNVTHHLEYEIMGLGNIYYRGNPPEISGTATGSGKLIKYE
jgi:hypothetical protein